MPKWKTRSTATSRIVIASTGVPSTMIRLVAYIDQMNSGSRNQVMPGARMRWIVTMKFRPVRIDEKPGDEDAERRRDHVRVGRHRAERRVERPAGIDAARDERIQREQPADDVDVPAQQIQLRKREILRADHHRDEEVAQHRRNRRDQEEEHHDDAVHREELVVGLVGHQIAGRRRELEADQHGERAAEEEEERDGGQIEQRDALVIARQQPRLDAVAVVQIVPRRNEKRAVPCTALSAPAAMRLQATSTYSISSSRLLFGHQTLKRRHDRLKAGRDLCRRIQDRLAHVGLVDRRRLAALQRDGLAEESLEHRTAALRVGPMTGVAREVREQLGAAYGERSFGPPPLSHV